MKSSLLSFCVLSGFFTMYMLVRSANGQWFEDPSLTYQNMTFDMSNRGSYNTSDCLFDLLQCWEVIKPDMICFWYYHYASYCSIMRELCAESYGDLDNYSQKLSIVQSVCYKNWQQKWT